MIPEHLKETARKIIQPNHPFGPCASEDIRSNGNIQEIIFATSDKLNKALDTRPTFILGRRGAGKTAFLSKIKFSSKNDFVVEIAQNDIFTTAYSDVEKYAEHGDTLVETIAKLWRMYIITIAMLKMAKHAKGEKNNQTSLDRYVSHLDIDPKISFTNLVKHVINKVSPDSNNSTKRTVPNDLISYMESCDYEDAYNECINHLLSEKKRCIILVDSLEKYPPFMQDVDHSICGLLSCISSFNSDVENPFHIHFCLPSELYHDLKKISSNPAKDFRSMSLLSWHPKELLGLIAKRIYLSVC